MPPLYFGRKRPKGKGGFVFFPVLSALLPGRKGFPISGSYGILNP